MSSKINLEFGAFEVLCLITLSGSVAGPPSGPRGIFSEQPDSISSKAFEFFDYSHKIFSDFKEIAYERSFYFTDVPRREIKKKLQKDLSQYQGKRLVMSYSIFELIILTYVSDTIIGLPTGCRGIFTEEVTSISTVLSHFLQEQFTSTYDEVDSPFHRVYEYVKSFIHKAAFGDAHVEHPDRMNTEEIKNKILLYMWTNEIKLNSKYEF